MKDMRRNQETIGIMKLRHKQKRKEEDNDRKVTNKEKSGLENHWIKERWGINVKRRVRVLDDKLFTHAPSVH